jgi:class 3 adenylate cyclase/predicted ATPase
MTCPSCGALAPAGARFCSICGHSLVARSDERRVVTVLFADLVGFTGLSETMDPEQLKNLIDDCFECLVADVTAFGGQVDKIIGDAILALFGAPIAHEDDGERAVRAALRMQQSIAQHIAGIANGIEMRVGVNTGEVLVGALRAGGDYTAMGDVVNTANRLQSVAKPGQVLVGPATHAATHQVVRYDHLGPVQARGREEPVEAWIAVETIAPPGHRPRRLRAPLVGRTTELGLISSSVEMSVQHSRAQLILLIGEAGVGKSRLAEEAASLAEANHEAAVLEGRCVPYGEANIWWPIGEALRDGTGVHADDSEDVARRRCLGAVAAVLEQPTTADEVARIAEGLLFYMGFATPLDGLDPARAREEAALSLFAFTEAYLRVRPVVVVLSDLHWADDLVLELLDRMLRALGSLPFVVVATARVGEDFRWRPQGRHNTVAINLDPLDRVAARQLLDSVAEARIPRRIADQLLDRSGGNPFFLEELASLICDTADISDDIPDLPDNIRGLVAARLDTLSPGERATLEDAAVLGRSGPVSALASLAEERVPIDAPAKYDDDGKGALGGLVAKDLLVLEGDRWTFRSESVREVAYNTLTKASRARRHSAIADIFQNDELMGRGERLEQVAVHLAAASELVSELGPIPGVPDDVRSRAAGWLAKAAKRAYTHDMSGTALRLSDRALSFLDPEDEETASPRRRLLTLRAWAKSALRDLPGARMDVMAALSDADRAGDQSARAQAMSVLGQLLEREGHLEESAATLWDAIALWRDLGQKEGLAEALRYLGFTSIFLRTFEEGEAALVEARELFIELGDKRGEAWAIQYLAFMAFSRGDLDEANPRLQESLRMFSELGDQFGMGWSRGLLAWVRYNEGNFEEAEALAELAIGARESDKWAHGMMLVLLANLRLWRGHARAAIPLASEARGLFHSIGDHYGRAMALSALGRAQAATGDVAEAEKSIEEVLAATGAIASEKMGATIAGSTYLHLGEADRALSAYLAAGTDPAAKLGLGDLEWMVGTGLAYLQLAKVDEALVLLEGAVAQSPDTPYGVAALALARDAVGEASAAIELAESASGFAGASYLDNVMADAARVLAYAQLGDEKQAMSVLDEAIAQVDATDDLVARRLMRLAGAEALASLGAPGADEMGATARAELAALGAPAEGWGTAFRLAALGRGAGEGGGS